MPGSVIVSGARTPIGKMLGSLTPFAASDLGGLAVKAAIERAGIGVEVVDYAILGQVIQAGAGQMPARQATVAAGLPLTTPSLLVNKVCLSGLDAIALADQLISAGEFDVIVAGGMESMTNAPHVLPGARKGFKYGDATLVDSLSFDALTCAIEHKAMGEATDDYNVRYGLTRAEQDEYAARSHELAAAAQKAGRFANEIVPVALPSRGEPITFSEDEGIRPETSAESLARLRPAFRADGTITAGSASQISDGACAVVVMSAEKARELGCDAMATIGHHGVVAGPDPALHTQPSNAIRKALSRAGKSVDDLALLEINEAFAAVALQSVKELGVEMDKVNVDGGAIALGHPVGASGARVLLHLVEELRRRGGGLGAAALCGGGGQGDALLVEV